jgi:hypothetical protein
MNGTPGNTVAPDRATSSTNRSGMNDSRITIAEPWRMSGITRLPSPYEWDNGIAAKFTSSGPMAIASMM